MTEIAFIVNAESDFYKDYFDEYFNEQKEKEIEESVNDALPVFTGCIFSHTMQCMHKMYVLVF